ncbi:MAG: insulinase family protein [Bacilli bacterium]|nr:insulinase family protein [Bacilli bacterium]
MQEIKLSKLDEVIYYDICDNGLPVYMWVNNKVNNFYATINFKYGSVDTEFKLEGEKEYTKVSDGIAHFLEHVKFNEKDGKTAHDYFNELGSSINAFTTFEFTSYEVFSSTEFEKNLTHLLDYTQDGYFTKALVNKEKGIITEEVKMGKNNPGHKLYYGMNKALFKKDKRRNLITGEVKDVKGITVEEIKKVFDVFYHPMNSFVVITGNFDPEEAMKIIKKNQEGKKFKKYKNPIKKEVKEPLLVKEEYKEIEANVELPKVKIAYKMPLSVFGDMDKRLVNIYLSIILRNNFGPTSLFRDELLEKGLVTGIGATREIFKDVVTIEVNLETRDPDKVIKLVKDKINNMSLTEEEIKRRIRSNIASLINDYDDIEYVNSDIVDQLITNGFVADNLYDVYSNLNLDEANYVMSKIDLSNGSVVMLVPFKD